jgi:hypothetical protein
MSPHRRASAQAEWQSEFYAMTAAPFADGAVWEQPLLPQPIDDALRSKLRAEAHRARRGQEAVQRHTVESADRNQTSQQQASAAVRFRELLQVVDPAFVPCPTVN